MNIVTNVVQKKSVAMYALVFVLGGLFTVVALNMKAVMSTCNQSYNLLNPNIRCKDVLQQGEWDYEPLRDQLSLLKSKVKEEGKISHLSIYFRDLTHGPRFGIGEYDKFHPASLTKVPVMIALLHEADIDPNVLNKKLSYSGSLNVVENVEQPDETIKPHTLYTIRELIEKMILYSDNYSYKLLIQDINSKPPLLAYFTFRDLDVLRMMLAPEADYVSIQSYANLFAILYNTGYLSKNNSQFALELLSQTTFDEGLTAGVPKGTIVANKFGRRTLENEDDQLHDCGIVYHPQMPYILCVMTSGPDYEEQKTAIATVSRLVYDSVSALHLN